MIKFYCNTCGKEIWKLMTGEQKETTAIAEAEDTLICSDCLQKKVEKKFKCNYCGLTRQNKYGMCNYCHKFPTTTTESKKING